MNVCIEIDDGVLLRSDPDQWMLVREWTTKYGTKRERVTGYYVSIESALRAYVDAHLRQSGATTPAELLAALEHARSRAEHARSALSP